MDGCETEAEWFLCCCDDSHHEVPGQSGRSRQSVSTIRSNMPVALLSLSPTSLRLTLLLLLLRSIHLSWLVVWWWCPSGVTICSGASRTAAWSSWTSWRSSTCRGWALVKLLLVTGVQELLCTLLCWPGGGTGQRREKTGSGFIEQDNMLRLTK